MSLNYINKRGYKLSLSKMSNQNKTNQIVEKFKCNPYVALTSLTTFVFTNSDRFTLRKGEHENKITNK